MTSFEVLDKVADAYTPLLGLVWLALVSQSAIPGRWRQALWRLAIGLCGLIVAYSLMWADSAFGLWASVKLDYSTHAAVAFVLAVAIGASSHKLRLVVAATLLAYLFLMLYQKYHTVADIASTLAVVAGLLAMLAYLLRSRAVRSKNAYQTKSSGTSNCA